MVLWCEEQDPVVTTNIGHALEYHIGLTFHPWWALDQIWVHCSNEKQAVTCWLPVVCGVSTCSTCILSLCCTGEVWLFQQKLGSIQQSSPKLLLSSSSMDTFRASSSSGWPLQGSSQMDWSFNLKFWDQCLVVHSLAALSPQSWRIWWLNVAADKLSLKW